MLLTLLLACTPTPTVTETKTATRSMRIDKPVSLDCTPEPSWARVAAQSFDPPATGKLSLNGKSTGACDVRFELRDAAGKPVLATPAGSPGGSVLDGPGATTNSTVVVDGVTVASLELWVTAVGPADATATYTFEVELSGPSGG